jgi:hypothetical protein
MKLPLRRLRERLNPMRLMEYEIDAARRDELAREHSGELAQIFFGSKTRLVHKWLHYLDIYERHFARYRGTPVRFLEIGVSKGGSLEMWRTYFGPEATIYGIDVDPACTAFATAGSQVRIGSQDDPAFLERVVGEMGAPDVVLDDGSHIGRHQKASFRALFPHVANGGLYLIEDLHTAYWAEYEGGWRRKGSGIELVKNLIDDQHAWYHRRRERLAAKEDISAIHVYDSIVAIEKRRRGPPGHVQIPPQL